MIRTPYAAAAVLAAALIDAAVLARLASDKNASVPGLLTAVPAPWSAEFSLAVLSRLGTMRAPAAHLPQAMPQLLAGLHAAHLELHQRLPRLTAAVRAVASDAPAGSAAPAAGAAMPSGVNSASATGWL